MATPSKPTKRKAPATKPARTTEPPTDVATFIRALDHPLEPAILALRTILLAADPRIRESIKWNAPSFHTTDHFATFHLRAPNAIQIVLHLGAKRRPDATVRAAVNEPAAKLQWKSADRAVLSFADLADVEARQGPLTRAIRVWIEHV